MGHKAIMASPLWILSGNPPEENDLGQETIVCHYCCGVCSLLDWFLVVLRNEKVANGRQKKWQPRAITFPQSALIIGVTPNNNTFLVWETAGVMLFGDLQQHEMGSSGPKNVISVLKKHNVFPHWFLPLFVINVVNMVSVQWSCV